MPTTLYEVIMHSNVASVMTKDTAATSVNTKAMERNRVAFQSRETILKNTAARQTRLKNVTDKLNKSTKKLTKSTLLNALAQRIMSKAGRTAGINFGMLSLRISEGLVPVLAMLYTAMLPVAAGLLAIASAAVVATGGVLGLMGVGLYAWSKRFEKSQTGYSGARRPFSSGTETDFMGQVMEGFVKVLDDPEIKRMIDTAVDWTQNIFGTVLPNAFKEFLLNVDMGVMDTIMTMFTEWLPDAASGLAKWGSKLFETIGSGSLRRLNLLFKYLAQGLQNTAQWLKDGGFDELDGLTNIMGQLLSQLMELGKNVLPVLVEVLKSVYPNPLKPIINILIGLFDSIQKSEASMAVVKAMTQMFVALVALKGLELFLVSFVGIIDILAGVFVAITGATVAFATLGVTIALAAGAITLILAAKFETWRKIIVTFGTGVINFFTLMWNGWAKLFGFIVNTLNFLTGDDKRVDYTKEYRQLKYKNGEDIWSPVVSDNYKSQQEVKVKVEVDENQFGIGVLDTLSNGLSESTGKPSFNTIGGGI